MNYEIEYDSRISHNAILYAILFHICIVVFSAAIEIGKSISFSDDFVIVNITDHESSFHEEKTKPEKILQPKISKEILPDETVRMEEGTPLKIEEPVTSTSDEPYYVIAENMNGLLDSVLLANPTIAGLKTVVMDRMKQADNDNKYKPTKVEAAREQLKVQLIALYKDRYGDISPDKYAAQLHQNGYGISIPIPLGSIIDLLKDLF